MSIKKNIYIYLIPISITQQDCYILDQGGAKVFVWKGKKANRAERQAVMARALVSASAPLGMTYLHSMEWNLAESD